MYMCSLTGMRLDIMTEMSQELKLRALLLPNGFQDRFLNIYRSPDKIGSFII
ncbi:UNVERIFIED_CONTAM: hypothetical protein FKN15_043865 [Acipenser sinensis]